MIPREQDISGIVSLDSQDYSSGENRMRAVGGEVGIGLLADAFCNALDAFSEAKIIRQKYPEDLSEFRSSLISFLTIWMTGETPLYSKSNGRRYLSASPKRLRLNGAENQAWLNCMQYALDAQPYDEVFKRYVMVQLTLAAEMMRHPSN
ncbi:globin [Photobacterium galatheae]|uniref:globin domain-containing protein n=1 Tax=Photobacterium galatheae TaxID=1654360 RepID=UPI001376DDC8|nr:globin [Photobacterium galatheae]MCM0147130.1 globin [Photobacterium galatheae]